MMSLREAVRKRPGMFFGSPQTSFGRVIALNYLYEPLYVRARRGQVRQINLTFHADQSFSIESDGAIPLDLLQLEDPFAETDPWRPELGWEILWVCAVAREFHIDSYTEGLHHQRTFSSGIPTGLWHAREATASTGTRFHVQLDPDIFTGEAPPFLRLVHTFQMRAACVPGLAIRLTDEATAQSQTLFYPAGLRDYLTNCARDAAPRHPTPFRLQAKGVEVVLWWQRTPGKVQCSFANGELTHEGGTHLEGLLAGLGQVFHRYSATVGRTAVRPTVADIVQRLNYMVSVVLEEAQYPLGSNRLELANPEVRGLVRDLILRELPPWLEQFPELVPQVLRAAYQDARVRVRQKRRRRQGRLGPRKKLARVRSARKDG